MGTGAGAGRASGRKRRTLLAAGAVTVIAAGVAALLVAQVHPGARGARPSHRMPVAREAFPAASPGRSPVQAPAAADGSLGRLRIPSLGIDAPVLPVGIDRDGNMDVTKTADTVGWYRFGPAPSQAGDAVMTCHNQWYGVPRALCYDLPTVSPGADVYTSSVKEATHHWRVDGVRTVAYDATVADLFTRTGPPRLSIITCGGEWDAAHQNFSLRVIVDARLTS